MVGGGFMGRFIHILRVSLDRIQKLPRLLVASSDGFLYIYNVDPQDGGECVLVQKHRWVCLDAGVPKVFSARAPPNNMT